MMRPLAHTPAAMHSKGVGVLMVLLLACPLATLAANCRSIPARFVHNRLFVTPKLHDGGILSLVADTGGGPNAINGSVVAHAGWPIIEEFRDDYGNTVSVIDPPEFTQGQGIPAPLPEYLNGRFMVWKGTLHDALHGEQGDGMLGGRWFGDRIWRIDYGKQTMCQLNHAPYVSANAPHRIALGFLADAQGHRFLHFPSFVVTIDDQEHTMLFDTGANGVLSAAAAKFVGLKVGTAVALNFIVASVFDRWVAQHPDWLVIQGGVTDRTPPRPLLRLPKITVAGYTVGPVWFERQPEGLRTMMAQWMDRPPDGAIGGTTFQYFRILLNYPESYAVFERTETQKIPGA